MSENLAERKFSKLRLIPAIYMLITVLFSVMVFVRIADVSFRDTLDGVVFSPLLMAQSAADLVSSNQVPNSELQKLNQRTDDSTQIQIARLINRSGQGRKRLWFAAVFCLGFLVSAIGIFLKRIWAVRLGQIVLGIGAIVVLIAYIMTPRAYFDAGLSDDLMYILSIVLSVAMLLILLVKGRPKAELRKADLNEEKST